MLESLFGAFLSKTFFNFVFDCAFWTVFGRKERKKLLMSPHNGLERIKFQGDSVEANCVERFSQDLSHHH